MNLYLQLLIIPFVASTIGWVTNKIAVLMLFFPKSPTKILGLTIQGIFPKRQLDIANRIGEMVADNLLSKKDIKDKIFTSSNISLVKDTISKKLDFYLEEELKEAYPIASIFFSSKKKNKIKEKVLSEFDNTVVDLENNFENYMNNNIDIKMMISHKISSLETDEVNKLMTSVMSNELQFIEVVGAVLGFVIGLLQVLLVNFI